MIVCLLTRNTLFNVDLCLVSNFNIGLMDFVIQFHKITSRLTPNILNIVTELDLMIVLYDVL